MFTYIYQSVHNFFIGWLLMYPIFIVMIVGLIIQLTKVIIDIIRYKRFYFGHVFSSGGFPSFHTGLASSVTMLVLLDQWAGSLTFAIVFAFSLLFAYDAMNLRFEAWQHAHYINDLRFELQNVLQKKEWPLKERIGHTPLEVAGGVIFWSVLTFLIYYRRYIA